MLLAPEARLVLLTAGGSRNDAALRQLLNGRLDWVKVFALARREHAESILWRCSNAVQHRPTPDAPREALQRIAMIAELNLVHLKRLLHRALGALAAAGIDAMLLKGGALAYTAYASFLDRPMGDVDLLVWPDRAEEAWSLLQTQGWNWWSDQFPADRYRMHHHLPPLSAGSVGLEVHRALLPPGHPFLLAPETVWLRAQQITVDGQVVWVPDPLHQLLHLCIHFAWSHGMQMGAWRAFRDVEAITAPRDGHVAAEPVPFQLDGTSDGSPPRVESSYVRASRDSAEIVGTAPAVDWTAFVDLARESRAATCGYWTLRLARSLVGAQVPEGVLQALRPPLPTFLLNRLERHYVLQLFPTESGCPSVRLRLRLWELGFAPRWSEHGAARPWRTPWPDSADRRSSASPRQLLNQVRRAGASLGYLGRIIATPGHPAAH